MRYAIAIFFAVIGAALAMMFISPNVASNVVASYRFDNPDTVADLHMAVYMGVNALGLVLGWIAGWILGTPFRNRAKAS